ncbi:MAG TPA: PepSY-associated TM helix domain-containing protein [Woeseiaceae bacterium]|nr:PepSY-associated TM helix domain-containing protein [Woeseiaceae bacterium]
MTVSRGRQRFPAWSPELARAALSGHSVLGLSLGVLLYLTCLTGTLSVFREELSLWEAPFDERLEQLSPELATRVVHEAVDPAVEEPGDIMLGFPRPERPYGMLHVSDGEQTIRRAIGAGGAMSDPLLTPWTDFLVQLHADLRIPRFGPVIVGLLGVFLLSSLLTGLVAHRKILIDAFAIRRAGSPRLLHADLHNRLGAWGLPFHLLIAVTGAFLALTPPLAAVAVWYGYADGIEEVAAVYNGEFPAPAATAAVLPDIGSIMAGMRRIAPRERIEHLVLRRPGTVHQVVDVETDVFPHLAYAEVRRFASDGEYLGSRHYSDGPAGLQFFAASGTLHLGDFDRLAVRIVYGLLGLALTVCCVCGVNAWFKSAIQKGRAVAAADRLWRAAVWGIPMSLGACALVSLVSGGGLATIFYAVLAGVLASAVIRVETDAYDRFLRGALAIVLWSIALAFGIVHGRLSVTPNNLLVGGLLLATGAVLAGSLPRIRNAVTRCFLPLRQA